MIAKGIHLNVKKWQFCWKAKGWGLGSVPLGTSPGSVGSQSGHLHLPPSLSVNFPISLSWAGQLS